MSASMSIEGTYRIFLTDGCLTSFGDDQPLRILSPTKEQNQLWEVKKHDQDEYVILLKHDTKTGATYPQSLQPITPVVLGQSPRRFKIRPTDEEKDHFIIAPAEERSDLVMAMSPYRVYPPMVAMMPKEMRSLWRLERA